MNKRVGVYGLHSVVLAGSHRTQSSRGDLQQVFRGDNQLVDHDLVNPMVHLIDCDGNLKRPAGSIKEGLVHSMNSWNDTKRQACSIKKRFVPSIHP
jgi:hypothetical protein